MECTFLRDQMLEVMYGEADPATVRRVAEHRAACAACRQEEESLRRVRRDLGAWAVPDDLDLPAALPAAPAAPRTRRAAWPVALAASLAGLGLGVGLGYAGAQARFAEMHQRLASLEARQQADLARLQTTARPTAPAAAATVGAHDDAALLQRVSSLVRESEERQQQRLRQELVGLGERTEAQRRHDLARIRASLAYLDDKTGQDVARTTELMGYVLQARQGK